VPSSKPQAAPLITNVYYDVINSYGNRMVFVRPVIFVRGYIISIFDSKHSNATNPNFSESPNKKTIIYQPTIFVMYFLLPVKQIETRAARARTVGFTFSTPRTRTRDDRRIKYGRRNPLANQYIQSFIYLFPLKFRLQTRIVYKCLVRCMSLYTAK